MDQVPAQVLSYQWDLLGPSCTALPNFILPQSFKKITRVCVFTSFLVCFPILEHKPCGCRDSGSCLVLDPLPKGSQAHVVCFGARGFWKVFLFFKGL